MRYAALTAVRDEERDLPRLAEALCAQTRLPSAWVIIENGSCDSTAEIAQELARREPWITLLRSPAGGPTARGGPIVRAFNIGLSVLPDLPDVIVKLDADISFAPDYFQHVLDAFAEQPRLGIASGTAYEETDGEWRPQYMTGESAWGAARAYRRECLEEIAPLVEQIGWDTVDALKAKLAGWEIRTLAGVPFLHHRKEGARDGSGPAWEALGRCAYFLHYRPSYQLVRTLHQVRRDPAAIRMLSGYVGAALAREERFGDASVTGLLREQQRLRRVFARRAEALGRVADAGT